MCYMKHKKNYRLLEVLVPLENVAAAYEIFSMHHHQEKQWKSGGKSNQANHQKKYIQYAETSCNEHEAGQIDKDCKNMLHLPQTSLVSAWMYCLFKFSGIFLLQHSFLYSVHCKSATSWMLSLN